MDSTVQRDGHLIDVVERAWREDTLPCEDIAVPHTELPEPEQDNGNSQETIGEQEQKWTDLALNTLQENHLNQQNS